MKTIYIKNMVCSRCIKVVREELEKLGLKTDNVKLGEAVIFDEEEKVDMQKIESMLKNNGFELLDDKQAKIAEKIKIIIIELIQNQSEDKTGDISFSKLLSDNLNVSYQYLSNLFSSMEGITIEKFIINQKIEKVKELIIYDELTLSEIAYKLQYSSVQHLSSQFKRVTGLTPTQFKNLKEKHRIPLDQLN